MASKRQRRRKRQRAAAKRTTTVKDFKWREYIVAGWSRAKGGPVRVVRVKEYDEDKLFEFVMRVFEVKHLDEFDVLDIHRMTEDNKIDVIYEASDWPKGVTVAREKGTYMRGTYDAPMMVGGTVPAGTTPLVKEEPNKKETIVVPPVVSFKKLPFKWYTIGTLKGVT